MKRLLVVLDGVGDLPHPDLGEKTPLQAAAAPNLARLAAAGQTGRLRIAGNVAPESDVGVCSVLGHNPFIDHLGRGFLEAKGAGVPFKTGDLALRANFASVKDDGVTLTDRRAGRNLTSQEAKELAKAINAEVKLGGATFEFVATKGHRGVLVIHADGLDRHVSNTDPAYEVIEGLGSANARFEMRITPCRALAEGPARPAAEKAACLVNEFTQKTFAALKNAPANRKRVAEGKPPGNALLLRDPETRDQKLAPLAGNWAILSEMPMEEGIAALMDMAVEPMAHAETVEETYRAIAAQTAELLEKYDGLYVHLKGPDVFGHDGDAIGKKKSIEEIDAFYFGPLLEKIDFQNVRIAVTGDHSTPCTLFAHSADPVPFLLSGAGIAAQGRPFDETTNGPVINGWDLMPELLANGNETRK